MTREEQKLKAGHTMADHIFGNLGPHSHGPDADHDHDDFEPGPLEENALFIQDNVWLTSVGIDIGSSGTQAIFSRLHLRRLGEELSSRYVVVERETLHQSPVALTPYRSEIRVPPPSSTGEGDHAKHGGGGKSKGWVRQSPPPPPSAVPLPRSAGEEPGQRIDLIDERALGQIIDDAYEAAGLTPDDIDAGAVILTGEALRRENAEAIAGIIAEEGGDFVCATAGHHMESMLAAYGSGAARVSHDDSKRILNVDIGGGTTKLAIAEEGRVVATAAIHIGGRLAVADAGGYIIRLDPAGQHLAAEAGFSWELGDQVSGQELERVADWMADALIFAIAGDAPLRASRLRSAEHLSMREVGSPPVASDQAETVQGLFLTEPLPDLGAIDGVMFSGGVAEFIYGRETRDFGDLGRLLGHALRRKIDSGALPWPVLPAGECIRATAVGASEYSVQLSGNTIHVSDPRALLPRRNLQALQPAFDASGDIDADKLAEAIRAHFSAFDLSEGEREVALALRWQGAPSYRRLSAFARGIVTGLAQSIARKKALYLILDGDIAQMLGHLLTEELGVKGPLLVVDGIVLWDFDYIDIGRIRLPSYTVPVTVKSLVFSADPRAGQARPSSRPVGQGTHHQHPHRAAPSFLAADPQPKR